MAARAPYRRIGIIGTGRVAAAIGLALVHQSGDPLHIWGHNPANSAALAASIGRASAVTQLADIGDGCDLIILAVSDDALEPCIHQLAAVAGSAPAFAFHVSGRSGAGILAPLDAKGWGTAAVHPAMTFTGDPIAEAQQMIGARFAVTASTAQSVAKARAIVALLDGVPVEISEAHRPLYHAALCHGANHLVTLIVSATEALAAAGVDDPAALLAPLARAALANGLGKGMAGLSGPLLRGDAATIGGHLVALRQDCPPLLSPYRAMASATLDALERAEGSSGSDACRSLLETDE